MGRGKRRLRCRRRDRWLSEAKPDEVEARFFHYFPVLDDFSGKSADLPGYLLCSLLFQELRFLCLCKESSKESTRRRGEKNLPALRSTPLRAEGFLFRAIPRRAGCRSARASNEMFRSGNTGSVSDEMTGNPIL